MALEQNLDTVDHGQNRNTFFSCCCCYERPSVQMGNTSATVSANINAGTGASVNVPFLTKNIITGPVNIYGLNVEGNDQQKSSEMSVEHREKQETERLRKFLETHKTIMKKKGMYIYECKKENKALLKTVYTELFITVGDMKDVNHEHEILKTGDNVSNKKKQDKTINCADIFTELKNSENNIVLTKGVAGIGKTVSVHKFILDWAEGNTNQDIHCVFLLPFREINVIKNREINLHEFLLVFYPDLKQLENSTLYAKYKLAFIFDGLDESHLLLSFESAILSSVEERASVDVLVTSLIKETLLPSALVWVTSRPAAANQIHPEYVGLFTEVRGFTDQQKEEYFRKRLIDDESLFSRIISHIKTSRSLYIMCHIPVFCWITATVLKNILTENNEETMSTTLTEMYIHFLLIQMNMKNQKYDKQQESERAKHLESNRDMILKLAKLAFEQLKKENIVFYEEDLKECGIDVTKDTELTGMIAEINKKEYGLHVTKIFCFVHQSVQEFLAAVHVFICYLNEDVKELQFFFDEAKEKVTLQKLLKKAVDKAIESKKGHLDLFLRFLMGISLQPSQNLLKGLCTHTEDTKESISEISEYIKQKLNEYNISDEASVNLFYCLLELKDNSLYEEIQNYLNSEKHPRRNLSSSMCTVLTYIMLISEEVKDEFNPKRFTSKEADYKRLIPAVRSCKKALFDSCGFDETCCEILSAALQLPNRLIELDLSSNHLQDSGINLLSGGLKSSHSQPKILRLCGCHLTAQSCGSLSSVLQSSNSGLTELDLSNNDLQDSGVRNLSDGLKSQKSKLEILRLSTCNLTAQSCEILSSVLKSSNSFLRELDLSNNDLWDLGVKVLSEGLKSQNCQLEILRLSGCMVTEKGCDYVSSALTSNPLHLRELDLSYNYPGDSGVKLLSERLKDCLLDKLNVDHGGESRIIAGLKKYACFLTLDLNTANTKLKFSEDNRKVMGVKEKQPYPDHPDRFDVWEQVMCRKSVCGRCYWEIEWSGRVLISVSYKSIVRKGDRFECMFGRNDQSWSLYCSPARYSFIHNDIQIDLHVKPNSVIRKAYDDTFITEGYEDNGKIGVYVDESAGTLSFYGISDTMTLIHTVQTTFTKPLYPGFRVYNVGPSVKLLMNRNKIT